MNKQVQSMIAQAKTIAIVGHRSADADCIGSAVALKTIFKRAGKEVCVGIIDAEEKFNFLEIEDFGKNMNFEPDVLFLIDNAQNIKFAYDPKKFSPKYTITIDHHQGNENVADYKLVDKTASCTCEIIYKLLQSVGSKLTQDKYVMEALVTGVLGDTGGLRYGNVNSTCFEIAQKALECGVNYSYIYQKTIVEKSISKYRLEQIAFNRAKFLDNGIAFCILDNSIPEYKYRNPGDDQDVICVLRDIEQVNVAVLLREYPGGYMVTVRTASKLNLLSFFEKVGGSGSRYAGGITLVEGKSASELGKEMVQLLSEEIERQLS